MKHSGRARQSALKLIFWSLFLLAAIFAIGLIATLLAHLIAALSLLLLLVWVIFAVFTFYFFRDPEARVPTAAGLIVSPGHGKVDIIDRVSEPLVMGGECQRVSIFLSVFNVHVQNAPISGRIAFSRYSMGLFLNALKSDSAVHNENLLLGFEASERNGAKIGLRMIAGLIARRIVPFVKEGEQTLRGERIGLIQFGSRLDLYLPLTAKVKVKLGDKVVGGETIMATWE
jgi:phosphatidylserine decarboxylase